MPGRGVIGPVHGDGLAIMVDGDIGTAPEGQFECAGHPAPAGEQIDNKLVVDVELQLGIQRCAVLLVPSASETSRVPVVLQRAGPSPFCFYGG